MFENVGSVLFRVKAWWLFRRWDVHVYGNFSATSPRNIRLGANVAINPQVYMLGRSGITIGDNVVLSARCMLIDAGLAVDDGAPASQRRHSAAPIVLEDGAWIGAGAIILAGVTVGKNAIVGAGSIVVRDVPAGSVVAGNPARALRPGVKLSRSELDRRPF